MEIADRQFCNLIGAGAAARRTPGKRQGNREQIEAKHPNDTKALQKFNKSLSAQVFTSDCTCGNNESGSYLGMATNVDASESRLVL
ncbi:hypothetical protein [Mesorhizobium shangrilense]|uniref:Uncharacterized protein n=1 Tax=Mesorhizobium shangrilense TaxID=460060 RepID=A0ABV2DM67_9HYPH